MKLLIATISCLRDEQNGRNQGARDTWLKTWPWVNHKLVVGGGFPEDSAIRADWLFAPIDDGYNHVFGKVKCAARYARKCEYDFLFVSDVDTYIVVPRLIACLDKAEQYNGYRCDEGHAAGGHGYLLGKYAIDKVADAPMCSGYQDLTTFHVLWEQMIALRHDARFAGCQPKNWEDGTIACHLGRGTDNFDPQWMRDCHERYLSHVQC